LLKKTEGRKNQSQSLLGSGLVVKLKIETHSCVKIENPGSRKEQCFSWLEKAYQERSNAIFSMKIDPMWDPVRSDPRFGSILRRAGLE